MGRTYVERNSFDQTQSQFAFETVNDTAYIKIGPLTAAALAYLGRLSDDDRLGFIQRGIRKAHTGIAGVWDETNQRLPLDEEPSGLVLGQSYELWSTQENVGTGDGTGPGLPGRDGEDAEIQVEDTDDGIRVRGKSGGDENFGEWVEVRDGRDGEDGTDGRDGRDGNDGRDGQDGRDGEDGADSTVPGPPGPPGADSTVPGPPGQDGRSTGACIEEVVLNDANDSQSLTVVTLPADYTDYNDVYIAINHSTQERANTLSLAALVDGRSYRVARPIDVVWNATARTLTIAGSSTATFRHVILRGCAVVADGDWGHVEPVVLGIRYSRPGVVDDDNNIIEFSTGPGGDGYIRVERNFNVTWFKVPGTNLIQFFGAIRINAPRPLVLARVFLQPFAGAGRIVRTQGVVTVHGGQEWYGCHINSAQHDNYPDGDQYNSIEVSSGDASLVGEGHTFENHISFSGIYEINTE